MSNPTKARIKFNGYAKWISIGLVLVVITYNALSTFVIRHNDMKHILATQNQILERIERIEDYLWIK